MLPQGDTRQYRASVTLLPTVLRLENQILPRDFALRIERRWSSRAVQDHLGRRTPARDIDPNAEPYRDELRRDRIEVYDLTKLAGAGDDARDRAFEQVGSIVGMIRQRMAQGQVLSDQRSPANPLERLAQ
jgi:hypothetical protein